ncbi:hypothetical protein QBC43DRAFT_358159 [Cladorrhinum sp. PSN259]|nr:hypothetical protein QBC43DRAFT_358159 [Cladorrhinum sp. PSN259]
MDTPIDGFLPFGSNVPYLAPLQPGVPMIMQYFETLRRDTRVCLYDVCHVIATYLWHHENSLCSIFFAPRQELENNAITDICILVSSEISDPDRCGIWFLNRSLRRNKHGRDLVTITYFPTLELLRNHGEPITYTAAVDSTQPHQQWRPLDRRRDGIGMSSSRNLTGQELVRNLVIDRHWKTTLKMGAEVFFNGQQAKFKCPPEEIPAGARSMNGYTYMPSGNLPLGNLPFGNLPYQILPSRNLPHIPYQNFPHTPSGNLPPGNLPSGNLPSGDLPHTPYQTLPPGNLPFGDLPSGDLPSGDLPHTPYQTLPPGDLPSGDLPHTPYQTLPPGNLPFGNLPFGDLPSGDLPSGDLPSGDLPSGDLPHTPYQTLPSGNLPPTPYQNLPYTPYQNLPPTPYQNLPSGDLPSENLPPHPPYMKQQDHGPATR